MGTISLPSGSISTPDSPQITMGTATINNPATSVTVTHGVDGTPTPGQINVTLTNDASGVTRYYVTSITDTTFNIAVNATPTTTATFGWRVDMEV